MILQQQQWRRPSRLVYESRSRAGFVRHKPRPETDRFAHDMAVAEFQTARRKRRT
jgi:hypothetical protein